MPHIRPIKQLSTETQQRVYIRTTSVVRGVECEAIEQKLEGRA